jgi:hypothetical protein
MNTMRSTLMPRDFLDLADAEERLMRFERYYEASAAPFEWKFTPCRSGRPAPTPRRPSVTPARRVNRDLSHWG